MVMNKYRSIKEAIDESMQYSDIMSVYGYKVSYRIKGKSIVVSGVSYTDNDSQITKTFTY